MAVRTSVSERRDGPWAPGAARRVSKATVRRGEVVLHDPRGGVLVGAAARGVGLQSMMSDPARFQFGDRVRHAKRPEWGTGTVMKVEEANIEGRPAQRLSVRFANVGVKVLSTVHAELEPVTEEASAPVGPDRQSVAALDSMKTGWLAPVAERKIEEVMVSLPLEVRDPFNSLRQRLKATLDLYRFDRSGRGLVDWAIAQSGLDDPLSRFTRQELEQHFDRWAWERDNHLKRLLQESRNGELVTELLSAAPPAAREAVRRVSARR